MIQKYILNNVSPLFLSLVRSGAILDHALIDADFFLYLILVASPPRKCLIDL